MPCGETWPSGAPFTREEQEWVGQQIVERVEACVRFDSTVTRLLERTTHYELGTDQEPELPFF